jgi:hypothetical protein
MDSDLSHSALTRFEELENRVKDIEEHLNQFLGFKETVPDTVPTEPSEHGV